MKPPPEEKLLRLIRGKGTVPRSQAAPQAEGAVPAPAGGAAVASRPPAGTAGRARRLPSLRAAIGLLAVVVGIELIILLVQVVRPLPTVTVPMASPAPAEGAASSVAPELPSLTAAASRPLFAPPAAPTAGAASPSGSATQLASRLTLMGIVSGHPAQAIIEDTQTKKSYLATVGQALVGGLVVEQIQKGR
ncbi:MAG: hypothetical protein HYZ96_00580, partial [Candidatus Omnitrophica bacterium]|nr:hypothetical protein [Candidatus Omnitrophota bacterium]